MDNCEHQYINVPDESLVYYENCFVYVYRCMKCKDTIRKTIVKPKPKTYTASELESMYTNQKVHPLSEKTILDRLKNGTK